MAKAKSTTIKAIIQVMFTGCLNKSMIAPICAPIAPNQDNPANNLNWVAFSFVFLCRNKSS